MHVSRDIASQPTVWPQPTIWGQNQINIPFIRWNGMANYHNCHIPS